MDIAEDNTMPMTRKLKGGKIKHLLLILKVIVE